MGSDMNSLQDYTQMLDLYGPQQPAAPFNYRMQTTAIMEHSRGIAWVADLYLRDVKVGVIEQQGDGAADRVTFTERAYGLMWNLAVTSAFAGDEEAATYYLLVQEGEREA
jgi:hypothetical protein